MSVSRDLQFCGQCGSLLDRRELDGRERGVCPICGWIAYRQLKVGACALVISEGRLLLVRRETEPFAGCWSLPAGYVENDESPETAAARETREETGVEVAVRELEGVFYFDDDPRGNGVLIAYRCDVVGGEPRETAEAAQPRFFAREDLPGDFAGAGHDQAIRSWVERP